MLLQLVKLFFSDFAEELKLQSLELGRVSHFEGWIHRVKSVSHLLLVLKPHLINPTLDLVKLNLGNIKHLWIQVGKLPSLFISTHSSNSFIFPSLFQTESYLLSRGPWCISNTI